jgi:hypothetical protein
MELDKRGKKTIRFSRKGTIRRKVLDCRQILGQ